jgi:AAA+ ATPase superfamily predicted ATPase
MNLQIRNDDIIVILGKRRSGKSNLICWLVQTLPFQFVILDVVGNLSFLRKDKKVEYHLIEPTDEATISQILQTSAGKMLVLDEADLWSWKRDSIQNRLLQIGRNFGIGFIVSARRPANIKKDLLSNCDIAFVFRFHEPRDVEYLNSWLSSETNYDIKEQFTFQVFFQGELLGQYRAPKVI